MASKNITINADTFKDISKLPKAALYGIYGVAILIVLGIAYLVLFSKQWTELSDAEEEENKLKENYQMVAAKAAALPDLKKDLEQLRGEFTVLLKQLPTTLDTSGVLNEIHQAAATNNVTTYSIQPEASKADEMVEVTPFAIEVQGEYDQVLKFVTDVGQLSRLITISDISLNPVAAGKNNTGKGFVLKGKANSYRSLESDAPTEKKKGAK